MPTPGHGTIGSLDYSKEERKKLAKKSMSFKCEECCGTSKPVADLLLAPDDGKSSNIIEEAGQIAKQMALKSEDEVRSAKTPAAEEPEKPKLSLEEEKIRLRKEASKRMQEKFRKKLMARTQGIVNQVSKSIPPASASPASPTSSGPRTQDRTAPAPSPPETPASHQATSRVQDAQPNPNGSSRSFLIEFLVAMIVLVIAAVLYRRSGMFMKYLPSSGIGPSPDNHDHPTQ